MEEKIFVQMTEKALFDFMLFTRIRSLRDF